MICFAANQAAQRDDGVILARFRQRARLRRDFERTRNAHHGDIFFATTTAAKRVQSSLQQALRDERIPAADDYAKAHATRVQLAFDRILGWTVLLPEKDLQAFGGLSHKKARVP